MEVFLPILYYSFAVAAISFTVANTRLFAPVRSAFSQVPFIGKLVTCGYCLGFWLAAVLVFWETDGESYVASIIRWLVISWLAGGQWAVMNMLVGIVERQEKSSSANELLSALDKEGSWQAYERKNDPVDVREDLERL